VLQSRSIEKTSIGISISSPGTATLNDDRLSRVIACPFHTHAYKMADFMRSSWCKCSKTIYVPRVSCIYSLDNLHGIRKEHGNTTPLKRLSMQNKCG
jgi:hypothetical protein